MKNILTTKEYWEKEKRPFYNPLALKSFFWPIRKHLEGGKTKTALEIGCYPGQFILYLKDKFNYTIEGIDFVEHASKRINDFLKEYNISATIYEENFLTWKTDKAYDLVCSFGFIEHFSKNVLSKVIKTQIKLTKKDGLVLITVPNFKYLQKILNKSFGTKGENEHNWATSDIRFFKDVAKKFNLTTLYLGPGGGLFEFWPKNINSKYSTVYKLFKTINKLNLRLTYYLNNKLTSPYIIFLAKKEY